MFASDSGKSQFDFHFVRKGSVWRRKNHVFFFPSLLPHQFVTFNLYIARKVAAEVSKLLWSTKKNIHSEQFLIFTFLRPYNTVGSAYEEGWQLESLCKNLIPPFPCKTVAFNVVQPYEPVSYLESGLKCPILPLQNITLNALTRLFFCRGCSLSPSRKAIYIARGSIPPLVPLGRLFLDVACTCPLTLFF